MGLNVERGLKTNLKFQLKAPWLQRGIRYLGIKVSDNPSDLLPDNKKHFKEFA